MKDDAVIKDNEAVYLINEQTYLQSDCKKGIMVVPYFLLCISTDHWDVYVSSSFVCHLSSHTGCDM